MIHFVNYLLVLPDPDYSQEPLSKVPFAFTVTEKFAFFIIFKTALISFMDFLCLSIYTIRLFISRIFLGASDRNPTQTM